MILRLRTNDDLRQLLKQGNSPAWRIAKNRVDSIQKVEIYNFEGTECLKGDFSKAKSVWKKDEKDNDRLVVAFENGKIEPASYKWVGQNPVKYVEPNGTEQDEEEPDYDDAPAMILAGNTGEGIALKYNIYRCQNKRQFRDCKYLAFYNDGQIKHLFKIVDGPYDDVKGDHPIVKQIVANGDIDNIPPTELSRMYYLKYMGEVGPIVNDSVGKNGKPVPFTYGQPRYTTLGLIRKAKKTSELVKGISETVVLEKKGDNMLINPNDATIKLKWSTWEDFDIAALCKTKEGNFELIYYANKGRLDQFPFMMLDKDEMAGKGPKEETIQIANLDSMEKVAIIAWDYSNKGGKANFDVSDVAVSIEDQNGFEATAKLVVNEKSDSVCVASITNTKDGFVFENISKNFMRADRLSDMWNAIFS